MSRKLIKCGFEHFIFLFCSYLIKKYLFCVDKEKNGLYDRHMLIDNKTKNETK